MKKNNLFTRKNLASIPSLCALMLCLPTMALAEKAFPCLKLLNKTNNILTIKHDPNWDDQLLVVNGKKTHNLKVNLSIGDQINICGGTWFQFGINFYSEGNFTAVEVSNQDTDLTVINNTYPEDALNYNILEQTKNFLAIDLYSTRKNA